MITKRTELTHALWKTNGEVEVSKGLYWYYLEVLPPKDMGFRYFVFQEGEGARMIFWEYSTRFTCALLSDYLVTKDSRYHMMIARTRYSENFEIKGIFSAERGKELPAKLVEFAGQSFPSPAAIEAATRLNFRI